MVKEDVLALMDASRGVPMAASGSYGNRGKASGTLDSFRPRSRRRKCEVRPSC